jgi:hypothetical protein
MPSTRTSTRTSTRNQTAAKRKAGSSSSGRNAKKFKNERKEQLIRLVKDGASEDELMHFTKKEMIDALGKTSLANKTKGVNLLFEKYHTTAQPPSTPSTTKKKAAKKKKSTGFDQFMDAIEDDILEFDMERYFNLTDAQQKKVRSFLSSADQEHANEVGKQVELKANCDKVKTNFKAKNNIKDALTDAQRGDLKRTRQWLECDIQFKKSALKVRRYELCMAIEQSIPEEQKKSIKKDMDGLELERKALKKQFATSSMNEKTYDKERANIKKQKEELKAKLAELDEAVCESNNTLKAAQDTYRPAEPFTVDEVNALSFVCVLNPTGKDFSEDEKERQDEDEENIYGQLFECTNDGLDSILNEYCSGRVEGEDYKLVRCSEYHDTPYESRRLAAFKDATSFMAERPLRIQNEDRIKFKNDVRPNKTVVKLSAKQNNAWNETLRDEYIEHLRDKDDDGFEFEFDADNYVAAVYDNTLYDFLSKDENQAKEAFTKSFPGKPMPENIDLCSCELKDAKLMAVAKWYELVHNEKFDNNEQREFILSKLEDYEESGPDVKVSCNE